MPQALFALKALLVAASASAATLSSYVQMLRDPSHAWPGRAVADETRFAPAPKLSSSDASRRAELEKMIETYAPRIWMHPNEPFDPLDPIRFIQASSLWLKRNWSPNELIAKKGEVKAQELGTKNTGTYARNARTLWGETGARFSPVGFITDAAAGQSAPTVNRGRGNHRDFFLRYEDPTYGTGESRDFTDFKLGGRAYSAPIDSAKTPIFWKLSASPALAELGSPTEGTERVLIEYWYHVPYSRATKIEMGNHQGDWEGVSMLVDLSLDSSGKLTHKLLAAYYASHDAGKWHCARELEREDGHPVAYSALGTHATYSAPGAYSAGFITDHTAKGRAWDTWRHVRPLANEPYFGFAGYWGDIHFLPFMSGPAAPDSTTKTLPNRKVASNSKTLVAVRSACGF